MDNDFRHKIIIEPVHGDIGLSKLETELIDTPTFQRLKGIKQLGFAHVVYPSAKHTRFEHSLGVMHIMSRILESFRSKSKGEKKITDEDFQKLRVAALLHDIGHYPYSHLMEKIDWGESQKYIKKKGIEESPGNSIPKRYPKHARLGEIVITERTDIKEKLKKHDIDPADIAALVKGEHETIPNLLSASLDVDRLDYLLRDSLNTGLPYGRVDLNYIVNNLELTDENEIVIHAKARNSAEHMLMARYFMFNTVYMHKTVFAFEEIVRKIIFSLWEKGRIYKSGDEIEEMARVNSGEFLHFDDGYLDKLIDKYANNKREKKLATLCEAVKLRKPPKLVYEIAELKRDDDNPSAQYTLLKRGWSGKVKQFVDEFNIPQEHWIFRDIKGPDFEKVNPFLSLAEARELKGSNEQEIRELVKLREQSGEIINLVEDTSSILHHLSRLKLMLCRLYAVGIDDTKAEQIRRKIDAWMQS